MNNHKTTRVFQALGCCLIMLSGVCTAKTPDMTITVSKPVFVLPQFTGPYSEREASIAPEEYEMAERWRELFESQNSETVLAELEDFYDIELSPAMLTLKAQVYFSLKHFDQAERTYLAVLARKPQLVRVHADLAQLYLFKEEFEKARQYFANAVAYGSNEAIIHGQLAYLNLTMHGAFSAISEYQQAIALEPENYQWQQGLLAALSQAQMYEAALALIRELVEKHPENTGLWLNQAAVALKMENRSLALSSLEMAILLGDDSDNNLKTAAQLHLQANSYDRALSLLKQHLNKSNLDMGIINEYLTWLGQVGMWTEAAELLSGIETKVSGMNSKDQSHYYLHRARIDAHQKSQNNAARNFQRSIDADPGNGEALLQYAQFEHGQQNYVKAELLYIRAEAVPANEKRALLERAQLYLNMKDYAAALTQLQVTYSKYPELVDMSENIRIVENIIRARQTANRIN